MWSCAGGVSRRRGVDVACAEAEATRRRLPCSCEKQKAPHAAGHSESPRVFRQAILQGPLKIFGGLFLLPFAMSVPASLSPEGEGRACARAWGAAARTRSPLRARSCENSPHGASPSARVSV